MLGESQYNVAMCVPRGNSRSCHRGDLIAVSIVGHGRQRSGTDTACESPWSCRGGRRTILKVREGGLMGGLMGVSGSVEGCEVDWTILDSVVVGCWLRRRSPCRPGARLPGSTIVGNNNYYINYNYIIIPPIAIVKQLCRRHPEARDININTGNKGHAGGYLRQSISTRVAREWPRTPACEQKTRTPRNKIKSSFSRGEALCFASGGFRSAKASPQSIRLAPPVLFLNTTNCPPASITNSIYPPFPALHTTLALIRPSNDFKLDQATHGELAPRTRKKGR